MSKLIHKLNRYKRLVQRIENWPSFIFFKMTAREGDSFTFRLRNSFAVKVEKKMLSPFRECFLDDKYLKHIGESDFGRKDITVIDIGANAGFFSLYMLYRFPETRVFSFEPMPFCFRILEKYQEEFGHPDWKIFNYAVSDTDGHIDFYVKDEEAFSTTAGIFPDEKRKKITVESTRLVTFLDRFNITNIDLLKLDCEGAEYPVIYTLPERIFMITKNIALEAHNINKGKENKNSLINFLTDKKFSVIHEDADNGKTGYIWAKQIN